MSISATRAILIGAAFVVGRSAFRHYARLRDQRPTVGRIITGSQAAAMGAAFTTVTGLHIPSYDSFGVIPGSDQANQLLEQEAAFYE